MIAPLIDTSRSVQLQIRGNRFVDDARREVLLRGVNVGGSSKVPTTPPGATHLPGSLNPTEPISFIGRPFPLEQASEHFSRLQRWGFNVIRLLTTWEAIEHAGPGMYDDAYLSWFAELVAQAGGHGLQVIIDPHQDAWGRWSGGDGAPYWTYTAAGLNPDAFDATEAAVTMQRRPLREYPPMRWTVNSSRFAARTMATLFFAGAEAAPHLQIEGESIQHWLQRHFLGAMTRLAHALSGMPHVLGYGFLNEAGAGFVSHRLDVPIRTPLADLRLTGFDGMCAAAGFPRRVPRYVQATFAQLPWGTQLINPQRVRAWRGGASDIWQEAGIWTVRGDTPVLLQPDYFLKLRRPADYLKEAIGRFAQAVQAAHPGAAIFVENGVIGAPSELHWKAGEIPKLVNATHWYDAVTLFSRLAMPWWSVDIDTGKFVVGRKAVRAMFARQIERICTVSRDQMGDCPTLIGEFGVPFDLNGGRGLRTGNWASQVELLDAYYNALDANLASATLWNYTADNSNRWGDQWNRENLSIYSADARAGGHKGERAVEGFCRPYARAVAGRLLEMRFDRQTGRFTLRYQADPSITLPTELYVPQVQYPHGYQVTLSSGRAEPDTTTQTLRIFDAAPGLQTVELSRREA
ncbi:MAG: cellulase family glycosylhydrolase [Roseiflexaceae bacterium]